jgi:hypothetical protein
MADKFDLSTESGQVLAVNRQKVKASKARGFSVQESVATAGTIRISDSVKTQSESPVVEEKPVDEAPKQTDSAPVVTLTSDQIKDLMTAAIKQAIDPIQAEKEEALKAVESAKAEAEVARAMAEEAKAQATAIAAEKAETEQKLSQAQKDAQVLSDLGKLMGGGVSDKAVPMTVLGEGSNESRQFAKMLESAHGNLVLANGRQEIQRDTRAADAYWRKNRNAIRDGVEAIMREKGFLQGDNRDTNAMTLVADIPSISYYYLSAFIRQNRFPDLIHWQFANTAAAPGTPPRLNTAVPRYPYGTLPTAIADRVLTPGTAINAGVNNVSETIALITILELGLGKDGSNLPVGVAAFTSAFSMANLEMIIERNLGMDYQSFKDLKLYSEWFGTDTVVYNDGGIVTTTASDLAAGDVGTITRDFLLALRAYMKVQQIPTYSDGYYGLVLTPTALANYMVDLSAQERFVSPDQMDMVTRTLQSATGEDFGGQVSGYRGTHDGFHIFEQNRYGVGSPGDTGVNSVAIGGGLGSKTFESNFAFGRDTICWATALPVEIRWDETTDFQRRQRAIWYSHEASGKLDVKVDAGTGQELRVIEVRSLRTPV